jgi:glycerol-3-phosphate dehydrogenase (NAD(P)+)
MAPTVSVLGAGSWGTALAVHLARLGHQVTLWGRRGLARAPVGSGKGAAADPLATVTVTGDLAAACARAEALVVACPSHALRELGRAMLPLIQTRPLVVSTAKGIELGTHLTMSDVLVATLGAEHAGRVGVLSGPSFAKEVALGMPTVVTAAAAVLPVAEEVQRLFNGPTFRVYTSTDLVGVQIGGAVKNVVALAAGVSDGMGFGANARAALITRGLAEISRLAVALGAEGQTLAGLSGLGDLVLTCTGDLSRNRTVGLRLGRGEALADIVASMEEVAEGVHNTRSVRDLAMKVGVEMPIAEQMYLVVHEGKDPKRAVVDLMTRRLRREAD